MSAFHWLLALFFLVPLAEIYILVKVGSVVGAPTTVLLVVFTAVLGAVLVRSQGFATIMRVQASVQRGEIPAVELLGGALILLAGALLLTPGFLTDAIGFACLTPALRRRLVHVALGQFTSSAQGYSEEMPRKPGRQGRVIEGQFRREDE